MLSLDDVKLVYGLACLGLAVLLAAPTIAMVVSMPRGEPFAELWLLGPGHLMEAYPQQVHAGEPYRVYLGVGNHMGDVEYYVVRVKCRNMSEPLPDTVNQTASPLPALLEYRCILPQNATWEHMVQFAFAGVTVHDNVSRVDTLVVDGEAFAVHKTAAWSAVDQGFYVQLFFELWRLNATTQAYMFHNRFVGLQLNMTMA